MSRLRNPVAATGIHEKPLSTAAEIAPQSNIIAQTRPGQEIICEEAGHIYNYEMASMSAIAGVLPRIVTGQDGILSWETISKAIRPKIYYRPQTALISLENTHNMAGGTVTPLPVLEGIWAGAREAGLPVHLDGARIFNAVVKLQIDERAAVAGFDSVSVCLSKGLGAPAGSVLLGSRDLIAQARRWRKVLGGGMRQAGVLAAAGLYALEHHVRLLAQDHANAGFLADGLRALGLHVEPPQTNILYVQIPVKNVEGLKSHLDERGILATVGTRTRLVTHLDVPRPKIETVLQAFRDYPHWDF